MGGPSVGGGLNLDTTRLGAAREQLMHNRGLVYACTRAIGQRMAGQPVRLARQGQGPKAAKDFRTAPLWVKALGDVHLEPILNHPLLDAVNRPNPLMTRWALLFTIGATMELAGRVYLWLREGDAGLEIWPLPPSWVKPLHDPTLFASYEVKLFGRGTPFIVPGDEIAHVYYPSPDDPYLGAAGTLGAMARAVLADEAIGGAQYRSFNNDVNPGLAIILGKNLDGEGKPTGQRPRLTKAQRGQIIQAVTKDYQGWQNQGLPIILDGLIDDVKRVNPSPREMDFLRSKGLTKEEITMGFGVNGIVMGQVEGANRSSSATADDHFVRGTINPKLEFISQALTQFIGPRFGDDLLLWVEPATTDDVTEDRADQQLLVNAGAITVNELRALHNLPPVEGGDALVSPAAASAGEGGGGTKSRLTFPEGGDNIRLRVRLAQAPQPGRNGTH